METFWLLDPTTTTAQHRILVVLTCLEGCLISSIPPALERIVSLAHLKLLQRLDQVVALHQAARMQGRAPERGPYSEFLVLPFFL